MVSLSNQAEGSKKINQKCRYLEPKIEKSKNFLSPFLTSSYERRAMRYGLYFRLKRACSPNYRGTSFYAPGRKQAKPNLIVRKWFTMNNQLPIVICLLPSVFRIFTTVESALQIRPFMQNKPNLVRRRRIANERKCCYNKGI